MKNNDSKSRSDKASMLSIEAQATQQKKQVQSAKSTKALQDVFVPEKLDDSVKLETAKANGHAKTSFKHTVAHANFDSKRKPLDPARPLTDMPEPARRNTQQIKSIIRKKVKEPCRQQQVSKWQLVQSPELEEHLSLLTAGNLAELPKSFYKNSSQHPLLSPLTDMQMLDLADIAKVLAVYPNLTRYGLQLAKANNEPSLKTLPEALQTLDYAADWEAILHPEHFDDGMGHIATDLMACSIVVHALKQCPTRQGINNKLSDTDIMHYVRSYVLAECNHTPKLKQQLRHTPIFAGHVLVAAHLLGWKIDVQKSGTVFFNVGSRCGLFSRYPVLADYYVNGWQ